MNSLDNCVKTGIPQDIFLKYLKLYKRIGQAEATLRNLNEDRQVFKENVFEDNVFYAYRLFFTDSKITDSKLLQYARRKIDFARTKDEFLARNLVTIFLKADSFSEFEPTFREFQDISRIIRDSIRQRGESPFKKTDRDKPYQVLLEENSKRYFSIREESSTDTINLISAYTIDNIHLSPFKEDNLLIFTLGLYLVLLKSDVRSFEYHSFFKSLYNRREQFMDSIKGSMYMIEEGLSDHFPLVRLILDLSFDSIEEMETLHDNTSFDKQLSKDQIIKAIIYKLPESFTKSDIRSRMPDVSESTLNRALQSLQQEGKITAFGTGRSASWLRIDHSLDEKRFED